MISIITRGRLQTVGRRLGAVASQTDIFFWLERCTATYQSSDRLDRLYLIPV